MYWYGIGCYVMTIIDVFTSLLKILQLRHTPFIYNTDVPVALYVVIFMRYIAM